MLERPADLPDYRNPPIDEVVVGVQFLPIEDLKDQQIREFWQTIRSDYPIGENVPRVEGPIESDEPPQPIQIMLQMPGGNLSGTRMWMISDSDEFLVQVQNSRFIQNWRYRGTPYGHFEPVRDEFWKNYRKFCQFLDSHGLSIPVVQQIEISYINWITEIPMADFLLPAASTGVTISGTKQMPGEQSWSAKYLIPNDADLIQRLYVHALPAIRPQAPETRGSQLGLIFRAARLNGFSDDAEIARVIDMGRVIVVEAFTDLTTPTAQLSWERLQ